MISMRDQGYVCESFSQVAEKLALVNDLEILELDRRLAVAILRVFMVC
jgi:hypothetical protein